MYLLRNEESEIPRQARNDNYVKLNLFQLLINLYHVILKRVQNHNTHFIKFNRFSHNKTQSSS